MARHQLLDRPSGGRDGWLIGEQWLYSQRAPGLTCLSALERARDPNTEPGMGQLAANDSKGCGGVMRLLAHYEGHEETMAALQRARAAAHDEPKPSPETLDSLGEGWIAEEALAMAVYVALTHPRPDRMLDALALAVSHSGDSDSTGSICGQLLGALHGETALPPELAFAVEGRSTIVELADDLALEFTSDGRLHSDGGPHTRWTERYPGG